MNAIKHLFARAVMWLIRPVLEEELRAELDRRQKCEQIAFDNNVRTAITHLIPDIWNVGDWEALDSFWRRVAEAVRKAQPTPAAPPLTATAESMKGHETSEFRPDEVASAPRPTTMGIDGGGLDQLFAASVLQSAPDETLVEILAELKKITWGIEVRSRPIGVL